MQLKLRYLPAGFPVQPLNSWTFRIPPIPLMVKKVQICSTTALNKYPYLGITCPTRPDQARPDEPRRFALMDSLKEAPTQQPFKIKHALGQPGAHLKFHLRCRTSATARTGNVFILFIKSKSWLLPGRHQTKHFIRGELGWRTWC